MNENEMPVKDEDNERPVPTVWRATFESIISALIDNDDVALNKISDLKKVTAKERNQIREYLLDYGATLAPLNADSWTTSVSIWMDGYWDVLIDLQSVEDGDTDLVLSAKVFERDGGFRYEIYMVYVP